MLLKLIWAYILANLFAFRFHVLQLPLKVVNFCVSFTFLYANLSQLALQFVCETLFLPFEINGQLLLVMLNFVYLREELRIGERTSIMVKLGYRLDERYL